MTFIEQVVSKVNEGLMEADCGKIKLSERDGDKEFSVSIFYSGLRDQGYLTVHKYRDTQTMSEIEKEDCRIRLLSAFILRQIDARVRKKIEQGDIFIGAEYKDTESAIVVKAVGRTKAKCLVNNPNYLETTGYSARNTMNAPVMVEVLKDDLLNKDKWFPIKQRGKYTFGYSDKDMQSLVTQGPGE